MAETLTSRVTLPAAALLAAIVATSAPALAQQPDGRNPFDGEWSLAFDVSTPPGGVSLPFNSPYHMIFHASKRSLQVEADGTFAWRDFDNGSLKINSTVVGTTEVWESHRPLLKAGGKATATPTPPGSPQAYERSLEVDLEYTGGNGAYGDSRGGSGAYSVDSAGEQMTVTGVGGPPTTIPVTYWQAKWSLKPARIVREEISPDEVRETTTYEGSREAENATSLGKYKVTERIEIKQVRNLNLVPRG